MKKIHFQIIGTLLAIFVGIVRAYGGFFLLRAHNDSTELGVGIALAIIGAFLIIAGICFLINMSQINSNPKLFCKILTIGIIAFWIDGIINGFLLYGSPQVAGQIINTTLTAVIILCLWGKKS